MEVAGAATVKVALGRNDGVAVGLGRSVKDSVGVREGIGLKPGAFSRGDLISLAVSRKCKNWARRTEADEGVFRLGGRSPAGDAANRFNCDQRQESDEDRSQAECNGARA